jgi:hypothetical protein
MVIGFIIPIAIIALIFTFRDQIKAFADDLGKEKSPEEVETQRATDERGALENTKRFILGEGTVDRLNAQSEANAIAINKFIADANKNLESNLTGINTTLVNAQKQLETFAQESQQTIATNVTQFQKDVDKNVSGIGAGISDIGASIFQFGADTRLNLENIFGGQAKPKPVATTQAFSPSSSNQFTVTSFSPSGVLKPNPTLKPKIITKQGATVDQSFLTPVETLEGQGSKVDIDKAEAIVQTDRATSSRFGGSGSRR